MLGMKNTYNFKSIKRESLTEKVYLDGNLNRAKEAPLWKSVGSVVVRRPVCGKELSGSHSLVCSVRTVTCKLCVLITGIFDFLHPHKTLLNQ